jgi:hypothetical protein
MKLVKYIFLGLLFSSSADADESIFEKLERIPNTELNWIVPALIAEREQYLAHNDGNSSEARDLVRNEKRLLGYLNSNLNETSCSFHQFKLDYAIPGDEFIEEYASEFQLTYIKLQKKICSASNPSKNINK